MNISIIIPTLNSSTTIAKCLQSVVSNFIDGEVIVVDGGSTDSTLAIAKTFSVKVIETQKGRGQQMHAGALAALGDVFLFLHSDSVLPAQANVALKEFFANHKNQVATFRLAFDQENFLLKLYSWMTRFDTLWTRFGDQGIVVRKKFYDTVGGFPSWPLFEDVHFLRLARRRVRVHSLPLSVTTSAIRFSRNGIVRQQIFNFIMILKYLRGESPQLLAVQYENFKRKVK